MRKCLIGDNNAADLQDIWRQQACSPQGGECKAQVERSHGWHAVRRILFRACLCPHSMCRISLAQVGAECCRPFEDQSGYQT